MFTGTGWSGGGKWGVVFPELGIRTPEFGYFDSQIAEASHEPQDGDLFGFGLHVQRDVELQPLPRHV
jgi:hypothetical protein